jgi:hypothetical protein
MHLIEAGEIQPPRRFVYDVPVPVDNSRCPTLGSGKCHVFHAVIVTFILPKNRF